MDLTIIAYMSFVVFVILNWSMWSTSSKIQTFARDEEKKNKKNNTIIDLTDRIKEDGRVVFDKVMMDWSEVRNQCRMTDNKDNTDSKPTRSWIIKTLISEHSPIRLIEFKWTWKGVFSWVATHFSRHWIGWEKWIQTRRSDRIGKDRGELSQNELVDITVKANPQSLINVSRFRLCYKASPETRAKMETLKEEMRNVSEEVAFVMQKNCIYRCGCPENKSCGYWEEFKKRNKDVDLTNIYDRYEAENNMFFKEEK